MISKNEIPVLIIAAALISAATISLYLGFQGDRTGGEGNKIVGDSRYLVPVAHPNIDLGGDTGKQVARGLDLAASSAIFMRWGTRHGAPERVTGQLHPVADPQNRYPQAKNGRITAWRPVAIDA